MVWGVLNPLLLCNLQPLRVVTNGDGNHTPGASGPVGGNCGLLKYNSLLDELPICELIITTQMQDRNSIEIGSLHYRGGKERGSTQVKQSLEHGWPINYEVWRFLKQFDPCVLQAHIRVLDDQCICPMMLRKSVLPSSQALLLLSTSN